MVPESLKTKKRSLYFPRQYLYAELPTVIDYPAC